MTMKPHHDCRFAVADAALFFAVSAHVVDAPVKLQHGQNVFLACSSFCVIASLHSKHPTARQSKLQCKSIFATNQ